VNLCLTCKKTQLRKKKERITRRAEFFQGKEESSGKSSKKKTQCSSSSEDLTINRSKEAINQLETGTIDRSKTGRKVRISSKKSAGVA
jgi:phage-related minor tail protein